MAKNGNIHPTRIFRSPDELELAWQAYKDHLIEEAHKWPKVQYVGKEGERVEDIRDCHSLNKDLKYFVIKITDA